MELINALIVSSSNDFHAQVVAQEVEKMGGAALILDSAHFPTNYSLEADYPLDGNVLFTDKRSGKAWAINEQCGVWWRRPRSHYINQAVVHPKLRSFAIDECRQSFLGVLLARCPRFFNQVGASRQAAIKPFQLQVAKSLGFNVPKTLITTSEGRARQFIDSLNGECVYKPFTGTDFGFFETRKFESEADLTELWRIDDCPIQIQEYVSGNTDLRVTVVGRKVFCAALDLKASRHGVDCRVERLPTVPYSLPYKVVVRILKLVKAMGLVYAAIDLRLDKNGNCVFFEVNPEGQYLWIEIDTGLPISAAIANELCQKVSQRVREREGNCQEPESEVNSVNF